MPRAIIARGISTHNTVARFSLMQVSFARPESRANVFGGSSMIIITGGAGFIGSALLWRLNQLGREDVLIVDELGTGPKWRNLAGLVFADYMEKGEFLDRIRRRHAFGQVDWVAHLGACSSTTELDASYLMENNFSFSKEIALFAKDAGARFVYASSAATYGDGSRGYDDRAGIRPLKPLNGYGFSKHAFDLWALKHGLLDTIAGVKYFNVFGPNEAHKENMRSMVCRGFEQVAANGVIRLFKSDRPDYADGEQKRDFLYVKDAVEMTIFLLEHPEANGLFNLGSGRAETWNDLAIAIFEAMDEPVCIEYIDMPENLKGKYQYYTKAEITRLREAGYTAVITPLRDAVKDYVRGYLAPGKLLGETE